jgi:hypothetical protein
VIRDDIFSDSFLPKGQGHGEYGNANDPPDRKSSLPPLIPNQPLYRSTLEEELGYGAGGGTLPPLDHGTKGSSESKQPDVDSGGGGEGGGGDGGGVMN